MPEARKVVVLEWRELAVPIVYSLVVYLLGHRAGLVQNQAGRRLTGSPGGADWGSGRNLGENEVLSPGVDLRLRRSRGVVCSPKIEIRCSQRMQNFLVRLGNTETVIVN